jgi:hypothetical protein
VREFAGEYFFQFLVVEHPLMPSVTATAVRCGLRPVANARRTPMIEPRHRESGLGRPSTIPEIWFPGISIGCAP